MKNVSVNHLRRAKTSPRSAANTPIWQVTDDSTRIVVKNTAYGTSSFTCSGGQLSAPVTDRIVKYIANSAEKNISSEDSHTIVPTDTMLGRVREPWDGAFPSTGVALTAEATRASCQPPDEFSTRGRPPRRRCSTHLLWRRADAG